MKIDPNEVFSQVEADRKSGKMTKAVSTAKYVYQASNINGYIEQLNTDTGERKTGTFTEGRFTPINK